MIDIFKYTGWIEGISTLVLFFVAVPIKYIGGDPIWVKIVGPIHGFLFVLYGALALSVYRSEEWSLSRLMTAWVLSIFPGGTFYFEWKYLHLPNQPESSNM